MRDLVTGGRARPAAEELRIGVVGGELGDGGVVGRSSGSVNDTKHRASGRAGSAPASGTVGCSGAEWGCSPSPASVGARALPCGASRLLWLVRRIRGDPDSGAATGFDPGSVSSWTATPEMCRMRLAGWGERCQR